MELQVALLIDYSVTQQASFELLSVPASVVNNEDTNTNKTSLLISIISLKIFPGRDDNNSHKLSIYSMSGPILRVCTCNPHISVRWMFQVSACLQWLGWGAEKLSNLPKVTG